MNKTRPTRERRKEKEDYSHPSTHFANIFNDDTEHLPLGLSSSASNKKTVSMLVTKLQTSFRLFLYKNKNKIIFEVPKVSARCFPPPACWLVVVGFLAGSGEYLSISRAIWSFSLINHLCTLKGHLHEMVSFTIPTCLEYKIWVAFIFDFVKNLNG